MNKLLDVAKVQTDTTGWLRGANKVGRECGVQLEFEEPCAEDFVAIVGTTASVPSQYLVMPFGVRAFLRRSVMCAAEDDMSWLVDAFKGATEYVLGRALVVQPNPEVQTWIGDGDAVNAATVTAARTLWFTRVVSAAGVPIMHVPPSMVPNLVTTGVLYGDSGRMYSTLGDDPVVINPGYEKATPQIFFTGEIAIHMSGIDTEGGPLVIPRVNSEVVAVNEVAAIDTAPCAIVRVGA